MNTKIVEIGYGKVSKIKVGQKQPLAYFGGPCAIESKEHAYKMADAIAGICQKLDIPWVFKS